MPLRTLVAKLRLAGRSAAIELFVVLAAVDGKARESFLLKVGGAELHKVCHCTTPGSTNFFELSSWNYEQVYSGETANTSYNHEPFYLVRQPYQ